VALDRLLPPTDRLLVSLDHALRTLSGAVHAARPTPRPERPGEPLADADKREAGSLMRVNHVGEVCAQALYQAQALTARDPGLRERMAQAAREEVDHLAWTQERLDQLGARRSWLNPLWYAGAFGIGLLAGRAGDAVSLGFVVETERQVEQHLAGHMARLPAGDTASRAIVERMQADEARHADQALAAGARVLPLPVRWAMRAAARVMTRTAHWI
jgi:ubiquinone biosynthesis monooxygenase Coq7